jgi:hypothetical protein
MKLQKTTNGDESTVTFIPETKEEMCIMGNLRNHYFLGDDKDGTYPEYDGITTEDNYVTSMRFKFKRFK